MRTPQYIIKIAADDVTRLRKIDVFRVLENCRGEEVQKTAHFIGVNRPGGWRGRRSDISGPLHGSELPARVASNSELRPR